MFNGSFLNLDLNEIKKFLFIEYHLTFADFCEIELPKRTTWRVFPESYTDACNLLEIPVIYNNKFYTLVINERN